MEWKMIFVISHVDCVSGFALKIHYTKVNPSHVFFIALVITSIFRTLSLFTSNCYFI